jgi:hypothetical protein
MYKYQFVLFKHIIQKINFHELLVYDFITNLAQYFVQHNINKFHFDSIMNTYDNHCHLKLMFYLQTKIQYLHQFCITYMVFGTRLTNCQMVCILNFIIVVIR